MRILWDKELFNTLDQEFLEFECERCIDEAKDWSELIVHKENSHGDLVNCCWKHSFSSDHEVQANCKKNFNSMSDALKKRM